MLQYSISIKWSDEDNGFIATIPELPGLSAFGKSQQKALNELKVATAAYLETLREVGGGIPAPDKVALHSGQLRLRMPKDLHAKLSAAAENQGVSLNTYIVSLISETHSKQETIRSLREIILEVKQKPVFVYFDPKSESSIKAVFPASKEDMRFHTGDFSTFSGREN